MPLKVIALPNPSSPNPALYGVGRDKFDKATTDLPADWDWVAYSSPASLREGLQKLIQKMHGCLDTLEIYAHGSEGDCNGLDLINLSQWAAELNKLDWCDDSAIYLSGCTTGCIPLVGASTSIAQQLSTMIPGSQPRVVTIFGSRGYISGSVAKDDVAVSQTYVLTDANGVASKLTPPRNSEDASGPFSWRAFQNGVQLP